MKSYRNALVLLLALSTIAASALAWRQYQELIQLRAEVSSDDSAGLRKQLADAQNHLKSMQDELAAARAKTWRKQADLASAEGEPKNPDDSPVLPGGRRNGVNFLSMLNDPQARAFMAIQMKGALDAHYGPLFKSLNLTPEQVDQFKNLMVQKQQAMMDALTVAREQGLDPRSDPTGFRQVVADAQASINDQIKATLGDAAYAQYQQYEQTMPQRNTVNQVQQSLSYTPTPLTDDQSNQLIQILAQNSPPRSEGAGLYGTFMGGAGGVGQTGRVTDAAIAQAQGVLSAPQLQALQQVQQQQQAQGKLQQLMRGNAPTGTIAARTAPGP